jgi:hypothetical protein
MPVDHSDYNRFTIQEYWQICYFFTAGSWQRIPGMFQANRAYDETGDLIQQAIISTPSKWELLSALIEEAFGRQSAFPIATLYTPLRC